MLFVTNRVLRQSKRFRRNRRVTFDLSDNSAEQSVYFLERTEGPDGPEYRELGSRAWFEALRDRPARQVLLYVHGYSNLPEEHVFPRAARLQKAFDQGEPGLVEVVPVIWPCDNDLGLIKDYYDDQKAADASGIAFARALEKFLAWRSAADPCPKRLNVLAHSMGNRVLREAVYAWAKYERAGRVPLLFRNLFLVAADVVNETLEPGRKGHWLTVAARNVCVYHASDDLALRASKVANLVNDVASRRLGHTGPEDLEKTPRNVYAIDCDDVNTRYDPPKGHTYFLYDGRGEEPEHRGRVFLHIFRCVATGRVPVNRGRREYVIGEG